MIPEPTLVFWILLAPVVLALFDLMRTPKVHRRSGLQDRDVVHARPADVLDRRPGAY